jgi:hypothetical protein
LNRMNFVSTRFNDASWQTELVSLVCQYECEILVGELDFHTGQI